MKIHYERVADALGTFSPIIILVLVCIAYLRSPVGEQKPDANYINPSMKKEQSFDPSKQMNAATLYRQKQFPIQINTVNN